MVLSNFIDFLMKAMEIIYGGTISHSADIQEERILLELTDYFVCRRTGLGYIISQGGSAGIWSYLMQNTEIEALQTTCFGRGEDNCSIICAPRNKLEGSYFEVDLDEENLRHSTDYYEINKVRETSYAENSLQDFIDTNFFTYNHGEIVHKSTKYIIAESSLTYFIETELVNESDDNAELLFDAGYKYGKKLADTEPDRNGEKFITEYLSACGWGDTFIKENDGIFTVQTHLFPWTSFWKDTSFPIYRGLVSGLLTGYKDRNIHLKHVEKDTKGEGFTVILTE